jgi:hypothetical protein
VRRKIDEWLFWWFFKRWHNYATLEQIVNMRMWLVLDITLKTRERDEALRRNMV